jgi:hypothetical protein
MILGKNFNKFFLPITTVEKDRPFFYNGKNLYPQEILENGVVCVIITDNPNDFIDCNYNLTILQIKDVDIDEAMEGAPFDDDEELFPNEFKPNSNDPEDLLP